MALTFRKAKETDMPYLIRTTLECVRRSAHYDGTETPVLRVLVESGLGLWDTTVACDDSDPDTIAGYVVGRAPDTVVWLHVVPELRRKGLGTQLLQEAGIDHESVRAAFMPTKLEGSAATLYDIARKHKRRIHFRPLMCLPMEY